MQVRYLLTIILLKIYLVNFCFSAPVVKSPDEASLKEHELLQESGKAGILPLPSVPSLTTTTTPKPGIFQLPTGLPFGGNGLDSVSENGPKLIIGGFQAIVMPFNPSALSQLTNLPNMLGGMG